MWNMASVEHGRAQNMHVNMPSKPACKPGCGRHVKARTKPNPDLVSPLSIVWLLLLQRARLQLLSLDAVDCATSLETAPTMTCAAGGEHCGGCHS